MPDINNLKELSNLFGVSIDFLLDYTSQIEFPMLRVKIELNKNTFSNRYDHALDYLKTNYPNESIYGLAEIKKDKGKIYNVANFLSWDLIGFIDWVNDPAIWFLVEKRTQDLIVKVTKKYIEIRELSNIIDTNKFTFMDAKLMKMKKKL